MTVMEALFSLVGKNMAFYYGYEVDPDTQKLLNPFWEHPGTSAQYRRHPDILGMGYAYKTNKYTLPLLYIVAMKGFNSSSCSTVLGSKRNRRGLRVGPGNNPIILSRH
jgi:hypothetical protein